jgi:hypothetical protein
MFSSIIKNYFTALLPIDSFDITNFNDKLEIVLKTNEAKNIVINELKRLFSAPVSKESTYLNVITRQKNKPKDYVSLLENVQNNKISISYSYDDAFLKLAVFSSPFKSFAKICKVVIDDKEILERGKYFFSIYTYEVKNVQKMFALVKNITNGKTSVMEVNHLFKIFKLMIDDQNTQCD